MLYKCNFRSSRRSFKKKITVENELPAKATQTTVAGKVSTTPSKPIAVVESNLKRSAKILSLDVDNLENPTLLVVPEKSNQLEEQTVTPIASLILSATPENIEKIWKEYTDKIAQTKKGLATLMALYSPQIKEQTIFIEVESDHQKNEFEQIFAPLAIHFFQRTNITFAFECLLNSTQKNTLPKYFTAPDKLKRLIEKNPAIRKFQKDLNLDTDYS